MSQIGSGDGGRWRDIVTATMQARPRGWAVLRALLLVTIVLMVTLGAVAYADGNRVGAAILGGAALALSPAFMIGGRGKRAVFGVGNYLAAVVLASVVALAWIRGGIVVSITGWAVFVPMVAALLGRWRACAVWAAVVVLATSVLTVAEWAHATPRLSEPSLVVRWISQVGLVGLSLWLLHRVDLFAREGEKVLSERTVAGQKLESLGRLAGGIAHDFNNVLAVVLARTDDLLRELDPEDPQYADLHAIRTAAKRGASLASELVAFSRRGPASYDVMRPVDVVQGAQKVLARLVRENVQLELTLDESVPPIEGDRDHLLQVLLNLVINGQDAMPHGGRLHVGLRAAFFGEPTGVDTGVIQPGAYAVISVRDEGSGMTPEVRARAFEPFFTTKDRGQGSGIGLASVHAIVTQHGGHVRLSSTPGEGSTFEVFLPLTSRSDELRETTDDLLAEQQVARLRVLLVEDDALVRRALEVMLSRAGHTVVAAGNGAEAIARWEEAPQPFDVLLTDVLMPGMTGPDLVRALREDAPRQPVVYMSGHVEDAMRGVDLQREHAGFVRKPASRAALLAALEQAAGQGAAQTDDSPM